MWNDLILAHEGPSYTRDTKIDALRLKFNAFKSLEGETLNGTFTRLKCLKNDLKNNGVTILQAKVNATFVNSLPRKWLCMNQTQRANNSIKMIAWHPVWKTAKEHSTADRRLRLLEDLGLLKEFQQMKIRILLSQTTVVEGETITITRSSPITAEEKIKKKNDMKERSMPLMAIPNEHLMTFNQYKDAKSLLADIETRFGGNEATKKTQKTLLKQMYENFNTPSIESLDSILTGFKRLNKPDLDTISIDDLYNNFKIVKQEVKRTASSNSSSQNMDFVSSPSTNSTNEVNTAYGVSTAGSQVGTASTQTSTANLSDATIYAFLANQSNRKKITINGSDTAGFDKSKVECYNGHKMGHFARECRGPRNQDSRNRYQDSSRRNVNVEETPSKAMVTIDGVVRCLPPKVNLSYSGLEEFQPKFKSYETRPCKVDLKSVSKPVDAKHTEGNEPKNSKKENGAPIIEDWVSDKEDEDESPVVVEKKTVPEVEVVRPKQLEKPLRKTVRLGAITIKGKGWHVNTTHPKSTVHSARSMSHFSKIAPSTGHPQQVQEDQGYVDSGCSRHMTWNMSYLSDFKEFNKGYVAFGGGANNGRINGKGTIKTGNLDFEDVYLVKELKFNLFSVSQMCDRKNNVLFTDTECLVLSPNFKLPDESQILLRVSRKKNMRLGHINFKNIDKLVKDNLVRGLPLKHFENDQTCVACLKGKQHKASCTNSNDFAGTKDSIGAGQSSMETGSTQDYIPMPLWKHGLPLFDTSSQDSPNAGFKQSEEEKKQDDKDLMNKDNEVPRTKEPSVTHEYPDDPNMSELEEIDSTEMPELVVFEEGIDYDEVFAPVARIKAIRLFLAYASYMRFMVYKMDVKSAFLYERIEERVYVCQPPGFKDSDHPNKVYKVIKALYGLHQALRAWYETLANYLLDNRFQRGKIDQTLFIQKQKRDIFLVQVYVDDIIFGFTKKELCTAFEKLIKDKFQMSSMGELTFFLGLQVKQKEDRIFISQDKYVDEILRKFGLICVKSAITPIDTEKPLLKDSYSDDVDVHLYKSMIGSLMYLTSSRPDIMYAVCVWTRFQVTPKISHLHAVKRIFRYVQGQPKLGLWYPRDSLFELVVYTNNDYAGATLDTQSTTGGDGEGSGHASEPQPPPSTAQPTHQEQIPIIASSSHQKTQKPRQALKAATIASLDAEQVSGNITRTQSTTIPNVPLPQGNGAGGRPMCQESKGGSTARTRSKKLSNMILALENDLKQTKKFYGAAYTKLIMKVKKLEKVAKLSQTKRKAKIVISDDEDVSEDSSKHRRKIEEIDQDPGISLVLADAARENVLTYTRRRRAVRKGAVNTGSERVSTASRFVRTAKESVSTTGALMPVSTAELTQESSKRQKIEEGSESVKEPKDKEGDELSQEELQQMMIILWSLVKERFNSTEPTEDKEREIWVELKRQFEPDPDDELRKLQKNMHDPLTRRLYDTCGVHHVFIKGGVDIYMVVEREYPLSRRVLTLMLVVKLIADQQLEMANELLRKIFMQIKTVGRPRTAKGVSIDEDKDFVYSKEPSPKWYLKMTLQVTQKDMAQSAVMESLLPELLIKMENLNEVKVKELRSDNGTDFRYHKLEEFYDEKVAKAFKVFNIKIQEMEENVHVTFSKDDEAISQSSIEGEAINFKENKSFPDDEFLKCISEDSVSFEELPEFTNADNHPAFNKHDHFESVDNLEHVEIQDNIFTKPTSDTLSSLTTISPSTEVIPQPPILQDIWLREKYIELVNIVGEPLAGITTRSKVRYSKAALAHEYLYFNVLFEMEPKKLIEALKEEGWIIPMQEEMNQFERNTEGINYKETFAPVTRLEAIIIFLAYAAYIGLVVYQTDVKSAFLNRKISEEVYVQQPSGFKSSEFPNHVCKLDKALYGMKQAPRAWYQANPKESHLVAVKKFKYLKGTLNLGLWYPKRSSFDLKAYFDSDYTGCNLDRKSSSKVYQILGGKLDKTYGHQISLHQMPHFKGDIKLHFVPTDLQLADIFTKPLAEPSFTRLVVDLENSGTHRRWMRQKRPSPLLSSFAKPLSFTQDKFIFAIGLPICKNAILLLLAPKETMRARLATLGLFDKDKPSFSSTILVNSSLLKINYFTPIWRIFMQYIVKCLGEMQSLILFFEKVNVDDTTDKSSFKIISDATKSLDDFESSLATQVVETEPAEETVATADATKSLDAFKSIEEQVNQPQTAKAKKLKEMKRLADLKAEKEKSEKSLHKIMNLLQSGPRLKRWLSMRPKGKRSKALGIPPPPELSTFGVSINDRKRKIRLEMLQEVSVKENLVVDGMHRNLVPPPGIIGSRGQVIREPES
nr:putative ribonuclease H-like domain-containing protein [Tanacetum cinerariifolium]